MDTIKYESTNGYTSVLCVKDGKSVLLVFDRQLNEVLHTASPSGGTMDRLVNTVESMPMLMEGEHVE